MKNKIKVAVVLSILSFGCASPKKKFYIKLRKNEIVELPVPRGLK